MCAINPAQHVQMTVNVFTSDKTCGIDKFMEQWLLGEQHLNEHTKLRWHFGEPQHVSTSHEPPAEVRPASQFWIQEQAPNGGFYDSIGLDPSTTMTDAVSQLNAWRKAFPRRPARLVKKLTLVVIKLL